jgi:hypothetical protein
VHLSAHPALQGLATSRYAVIGASFIGAARVTGNTEDSQGDLQLFVRRASIPWPPSPCTRLSRAPTTMRPPTPICFIAGLLSSTYGPPTFMVMDSAEVCRWRLIHDPSRSSRYPDRHQGISGLPDASFGLRMKYTQPRWSSGMSLPLDPVAAPWTWVCRPGMQDITWQGEHFP